MLKTAEFVSPKHPDKMCDQISDAILDFCLTQDPNARVAIETLGGHGKVVVMGEIFFNNGKITDNDIVAIVKRIAGDNLYVLVNIVKQSQEIAHGVDTGGAGDQGIMNGYACNDNEELVPQEHYLARSLNRFIFDRYPYDGKTQITIDEEGIQTIVASFQNVKKEDLENCVWLWVNENKFNPIGRIYCNPAGDWSQGGFDADTGLTGRKLMVDNYGPQVSIGGGCFSGKDATKVDRSGAYMARKLAVFYLKERNAKEVIVKIAYAIGVALPVMVSIVVDGKEIVSNDKDYITPNFIIEQLELRKPIYEETARWGHFGNGFIWDK